MKNTKVVGMEIHNSFPLLGKELKQLLIKGRLKRIFVLAITQPEKWEEFKTDPETKPIAEYFNKLLNWLGE
jgi:hypothetical protein